MEYKLEPEQEFRFQVRYTKEPVELRLIQGKAEVFAQDLAIDTPYIFPPGSNVAIYTWHGCMLTVKGDTECNCTASKTQMILYLNTHKNLENLRQKSIEGLTEEQVPKGPIAMVVGPSNVGKSTLCQMLLNYAVRNGRAPIFVDLDVGQGSISVPGTIGSVVVQDPISVEEGVPQGGAQIFHFGHTTPAKNLPLFNILVSKIASLTREQMASDKKVGASGVIINTCGWTNYHGYKNLVHIAEAFEVDSILVLDQENLYTALSAEITFINVVYLTKSDGVVNRSQANKATARQNRIRNYFYGRKTKCQPHVFEIEFSQLRVFKIGQTAEANRRRRIDHTKISPIELGAGLKHSVLALSQATEAKDILRSPVKGFIVVIEVHEERRTLSVLSAQPKPLPSGLLVQSDVMFTDSS